MANLTEIIGSIAAFLTTVSFLPQAIKTIKTKNTTGISLGMYLTFSTGVSFWLAYGILTNLLFITIANIITLAFANSVLIVKIINRIKYNEH